jgi:hypothetical protein
MTLPVAEATGYTTVPLQGTRALLLITRRSLLIAHRSLLIAHRPLTTTEYRMEK